MLDPIGPSDWVAPTDEELTALALAANPHAPLDPNAVPWRGRHDPAVDVLPAWYMPAPTARGRRRGTTFVIVAVCSGMLIISACGLCVTSGFLSLA
ncbi:MAG TPA: hypothetical protein VND83_09970 [Acidimicrobiales bacterium]|nr:hypothetical protein [Acidimicrobiales bacterium]